MIDPRTIQNSLSRSSKSTSNAKGADGREIDIQANGTYIQWRYKGFSKWQNLIALSDLEGARGPKGDNGKQGDKGDTGGVGPQGEKGEAGTRGLTGAMGNPGLDGLDGKDGADGRKVELRKHLNFIQWRYVGEALWKDLIALSELRGLKGNTGEKGKQGEKGNKGDVGFAGPQGPRGPQGFTGVAGPAGAGVATGGTAGQVLAKNSNSDYDTGWIDSTGGGGISEELVIAYAIAL